MSTLVFYPIKDDESTERELFETDTSNESGRRQRMKKAEGQLELEHSSQKGHQAREGINILRDVMCALPNAYRGSHWTAHSVLRNVPLAVRNAHSAQSTFDLRFTLRFP